jgi:hypothetical protein
MGGLGKRGRVPSWLQPSASPSASASVLHVSRHDHDRDKARARERAWAYVLLPPFLRRLLGNVSPLRAGAALAARARLVCALLACIVVAQLWSRRAANVEMKEVVGALRWD